MNSSDETLASALAVASLISRARLPLASEKEAQAAIEAVLSDENIAFDREYRLTDRAIPDFLFPGGVVLEVKMKGARKMEVYRQLRRYAEHPDISVLILATNLAMGLPQAIESKPVLVVSLGQGWL